MIATLSITFTPQTSINHRVCWKETTDTLYDCSTIATSCIAGIPKTVTISVTVFNESCDPIVYEGYVQPVCEPESSLVARTSFPNITFTPDNPCLFWQATCLPGIADINIDNSGSGYTPGVDIPITFTGSGSGATGTCYITDGTILDPGDVTITNPGSGYTPSGYYPNVPAVNLTGTGIGLTFEVTINGSGQISFLNPVATLGGTGYAPGDTVELDNTFMGGIGSGVIITIDTVSTGSIYYCVVDTPGSGYGLSTTMNYTGNADLVFDFEECDAEYVFGEDCSGEIISYYNIDGTGKPKPDDTINMCHPQVLPDPTASNNWEVEQREDLCCYDCEQVNLTLALGNYGTYNYSYIRCSDLKTVQDSLIYVGGEVPGPIPIEIVCYVKGSLLTDPDINIIGPVACAII